ncbi:TonB-dependent receptor domain-containing protein [Helicobacter mustelae]|uniref:Putative Ferric receptor CfrA n=1 Tax=Helicobacter mustelae (strain ATCC 43772 / CCUG 25715 / CIP 103759 / LMG 18044 / NCTC 12198 / R85-136P) TaxID=679897 RepID=D3UIS5_HELM1|nr:TonB-dependent receptor [Helicobacter mustelae]CBG40400.1 putative Ferric receptor CfrA [Helicobacter mustelae 12198]SQH71900.1 ferric receptor CfrA [Helicobacter mustelae]
MKKIRIFLFGIAGLSLSISDEVKSLNLDRIVTSASGYKQALKETPASVSVVDSEELKNKPVRDLGEAVALVPGVSIEQGIGKIGDYSISIRGMPSNYTLILLDGKRQNTSSAGFPNGFTEVFASFMPPLAALDRIEVIRGPASTLYGSDAIGGIVNIIMKKQLDSWSGSFMLDSVFQENRAFGNLYGASLWMGGPLDSAKRWTLSLRIRDQYRMKVPTADLKIIPTTSGQDTQVTRGNIVGLSESNNSNLGFRLAYQADSKNYFYLDYDNALQWYNNSQSLLGTVGNVGGYKKNIFFLRNNVIFSHQGKYENFQTDTSIQYLSTRNDGRVVTVSAVPKGSPLVGQNRVLLGQDILIDNKNVFYISHANITTLGARYWFSSLMDRVVVKQPFMYYHNVALFAENETFLRENLILQLGMRGEYNSSFGFHVSPRGYVVYNILEGKKGGGGNSLILKGGISTGYKTPTVTDLVSGINGLTAQGTVPTYGNPSLKPETSTNYEVSLSYENKIIELGVTGFFIQFSNKIQGASVPNGKQVPVPGGGVCVSQNGRNCTYFVNADTAISYGAETYLGLRPLSIGYGDVDFVTSYTYNHTEQTSGKAKGLPLTGIPLHSFNGAMNYNLPFGLAFYLRGELRAKQLRTDVGRNVNTLALLDEFLRKNPGLSKYYKTYFLLHVGGSYRIKKNLKLNFGIYNLLNHNFVDFVLSNGVYYNNYNYIREGRRYYASLSVDF